MGFALPALSFLRLSAGIRFPALALATPSALAGSDRDGPATSDAPPPYAVLTLNKARSRNRRNKNGRRPAQGSNVQMPLPLETASEAPAPAALRIIQRSPEQPERLFISGRMADVCEALERMEARESRYNG